MGWRGGLDGCPVLAKSFQSCLTLRDPMNCSPPDSRKEYWSGWPFPPPGDLPESGLRWCCVRGACTVPCSCSQPLAFGPGTSKWLLGLWSPCVFCPEFAQLRMRGVTLNAQGFFVSCCLRRGVRRAVSQCRHCSSAAKGAESQPVSLPVG